jgi:phosphatidylglycerol lysyltransferase
MQPMSKPLQAFIKKQPSLEAWGVRIASLLTAGMGVVNLISAVLPALTERLVILEIYIPLEVRHGSRMTSALAGFALFLLAGSLWRRKRTGWLLTVILLVVSIITHLMKGLDYEESSLAAGLVTLLLLLRHSFHAYSDRPSLRQGLLVLVAATAFTLIYGTAGFYFLDKHFKVQFGLLDALRQIVVMFTSFYNPGLEPITGFGRYFAFSIHMVGATTFAYALIMLVRPVLVRQPATMEERKRAEKIVTRHGRTALARPALFPDKSYFFSPGGSVIAYGARGRGAIVLGDPIGPPEDAATAIVGFRDLCTQNDWTPGFASVLPDYLDAYRAAGLDFVCIGHEAIVVLSGFTLEGSENKNVRNSFNKLARLGYQTKVHLPPLDHQLLEELRAVSDAWLTMQHGGEMHFSDGWFDDDYIRNGSVIVVHTPESSVAAFANLVTEYQKNEITIDLMRHFPEVESGMMEFLFASMLGWAKEKGYETFSLGLSALVGVGEKPDDLRMEQALRAISEYVNRFYNFKGLHTFKDKFHPRWEPRYLVYPTTGSLPQVLSTLLRVHSGDDFLWKYLKK